MGKVWQPWLKEEGKNMYGGWLQRYQHIERLGSSEVDGLLAGDVVVQEKLDGANLTVAWDSDKEGLIVASRNQVVSVCGEPPNGFNGAIEYVNCHPGFKKLFEILPQWVLRGEWLVRHSINYAPEHMRKFYVFDVQVKEGGEYVAPDVYVPILQQFGVLYIPTLAAFSSPTMEQLGGLVEGGGIYGATQKEGLVVKRYDFVNKYGRVTWGKIVCQDFKIHNKAAFRAIRSDEVEVRFAALCKPQFVLKEMLKIRDEVGREKFTVRLMPRVLGQVWHELFKEEMWDFVKQVRQHETFSFYKARELVTKITREVALGVFNALIDLDGEGGVDEVN